MSLSNLSGRYKLSSFLSMSFRLHREIDPKGNEDSRFRKYSKLFLKSLHHSMPLGTKTVVLPIIDF